MANRRPYKRTDRLSRQLKEVLAVAMHSETREEVLRSVVVTDVEVTRDLSLARVYFYQMPATGEGAPVGDIKDVMAALNRASGFLRRRLGEEIRMRQVPELRFILDDAIERGRRVEGILEGLRSEHEHNVAEAAEREGDAGDADGVFLGDHDADEPPRAQQTRASTSDQTGDASSSRGRDGGAASSDVTRGDEGSR